MVTTMPLRSGQSMSRMAVFGVGVGMGVRPQNAAQSGYSMPQYLGSSVKFVAGIGRVVGDRVERATKGVASCPSSAAAEKLSSAFIGVETFRHGPRDPFFKRDSAQPCLHFRGADDAFGQVDRVGRRSHYVNLSLMITPGVKTRTPNCSAAGRKSLMLNVTIASAWPLVAVSKTISSSGSLSCGFH